MMHVSICAAKASTLYMMHVVWIFEDAPEGTGSDGKCSAFPLCGLWVLEFIVPERGNYMQWHTSTCNGSHLCEHSLSQALL